MGRTFERVGAWNTVRGLEWVALVVAALLGVGEAVLGYGAGIVPPAVIAAVAVAVKALRAVLAVTAGARSSTVSPMSWAVAVILALVGSLATEISPNLGTGGAGEVAGQRQEYEHDIRVNMGPDAVEGISEPLNRRHAGVDPAQVDHLGGGDVLSKAGPDPTDVAEEVSR